MNLSKFISNWAKINFREQTIGEEVTRGMVMLWNNSHINVNTYSTEL
jgi:hypothetical protein